MKITVFDPRSEVPADLSKVLDHECITNLSDEALLVEYGPIINAAIKEHQNIVNGLVTDTKFDDMNITFESREYEGPGVFKHKEGDSSIRRTGNSGSNHVVIGSNSSA